MVAPQPGSSWLQGKFDNSPSISDSDKKYRLSKGKIYETTHLTASTLHIC